MKGADAEKLVSPTLEKILRASRNEWAAAIEGLSDQEKSRAGYEADGLAATLAEVGEYLDWRGVAGRGDHGHDRAIKEAEKRNRKVRRAMGYNV